MAKNDPLPDVAAMTNKTKVPMSWGAADGGFQYAVDLREKLMGLRNWTDPCAVYLDAKSIRGFPGEYPNPAIAGAVLNTHWKEYYQAAMMNAKVMVFIATPAWLASPWCAEEHRWFDAIRDGHHHMKVRTPAHLPIVVAVLGHLLARTRNDQVREVRADRLILQGRALVTGRLAQLPVSERAVGKGLRGPAGALVELRGGEPAAAAVPKISAAIQSIAGVSLRLTPSSAP